ncbi:uncharacterized protein [Nicotiana sylvestris]|uniref:uncharacterized protein n=1 Tax=Nicotiana sylvestris TaxID=4096 RepID=UPI00388CC469
MAVSANKRLGYLEQCFVELERKFLKRIEDCQNAEGNKCGHLARAYMLLGLRELVKLFDGAKDAESGEGSSGTKFRFNTENAPDVFYIQNQKKKPTETFCEYATRWRSEVTKLYERLKVAGYATHIPTITPKNPPQWVNPNKSYAYHSGMKGHTIDECRSLKDKIQALIDNKIIVAKEPSSNVCNNPLPDHKGGGVHMIEIEDDWDPKGSIGLITEGDDPKKPIVTLNLIVFQIQPSGDAEVNMSMPLEFEAPSSAKMLTPIVIKFMSPANASTPFEIAVLPPKVHAPFGVKIATPISVAMSVVTPFHTNSIPWDYTAEARRKGKVKFGEAVAAQGMMRTGRNALLRVLSEAYVPSNIIGGEMENMVGQVLENHKITFLEEKLPLEGLSHNKALHITVQCEDYFITRIQIDGGSSFNICPLVTFMTLGKRLHEIKDGAINVKAFDGSQRSTIGEISLCLQMRPTWFDIDFQVIDVSASYNLLLGQPWIQSAGVVTLTLY